MCALVLVNIVHLHLDAAYHALQSLILLCTPSYRQSYKTKPETAPNPFTANGDAVFNNDAVSFHESSSREKIKPSKIHTFESFDACRNLRDSGIQAESCTASYQSINVLFYVCSQQTWY